jgi:hypothetical protein
LLPDLETEVDAEIVAENLRAVQAIYFAFQLEQMRAFDVAERLVELSQQEMLPLGDAGNRAAVERYASADGRLAAEERGEFYASALGAPGGDATGVEPNREFNGLWLRFVAAVAQFARQQQTAARVGISLPGDAAVRRAARALAVNASARGSGRTRAGATQLAATTGAVIDLLGAPEIRAALGARDMWQVIDQVSRFELGGAVNVTRFRTLAQAGSVMLGWLAAHADTLAGSVDFATGNAFTDFDLLTAVEQWIAESDVQDARIEVYGQPIESPSVSAPGIDLPVLARELLELLGLAVAGEATEPGGASGSLRGTMALFQGTSGTGKSLAAHALAAALACDLLRVDLREIPSKYLGETEENLDRIFAAAERAGAVLLLDEADALLGGHSPVNDANDRYANIDIDGLLRRIETYDGLVIVASNQQAAPEDATAAATRFGRRCQVVNFPRTRR